MIGAAGIDRVMTSDSMTLSSLGAADVSSSRTVDVDGTSYSICTVCLFLVLSIGVFVLGHMEVFFAKPVGIRWLFAGNANEVCAAVLSEEDRIMSWPVIDPTLESDDAIVLASDLRIGSTRMRE